MTNLDVVRKTYTVDEIKALFYSMIDSIYDIIFNTTDEEDSSEVYTNILNSLVGKEYLAEKSKIYIRRKMGMDMEAMNSFIYHGNDIYNLAYGMITSYSILAFNAIRRYTGNLTNGRLHPDRVATNGCKRAYLFVHDRHPKHKLNKSANDLIQIVIDDIWPKEKNLGDI